MGGGGAVEGGRGGAAGAGEGEDGGRRHRITTEFNRAPHVLSSTKPNSQSRLFPPRAGTEAAGARKNLERIPTLS